MNLGTIVKASFLISFILIFFATCLKLTHSEGADTWLTIGLFASILFVATAVFDVSSSSKIDRSEKIAWILALIFLSSIGAILYLLIGRKRIATS